VDSPRRRRIRDNERGEGMDPRLGDHEQRVEPPDKLPEAFLKQYPTEGFRSRKLRDEEHQEKGARKEMIREEVERVVAGIKEKVFPLINRQYV